MSLDFAAAVAQKNELDKAADEILTIKNQLERAKEGYKSGWRSPEVYDMEAAIDRTIRRLENLQRELQDTGHCILKNAEDIQREEEERRAAEEARRRAEEESRRRAEEDARRRAEEDARRSAEESARQNSVKNEPVNTVPVTTSTASNPNVISQSSGNGFVSAIKNIWRAFFR